MVRGTESLFVRYGGFGRGEHGVSRSKEAFMSGFVPRERVLKYGHFVDFSRAAHNRLANRANRFHSGLWAQT